MPKYRLDIVENIESNLHNIKSMKRVRKKSKVDLKAIIKYIYDFTKEQSYRKTNALPELITEKFDDESIWQQIELQNNGEMKHLCNGTSKNSTEEKLIPMCSTKPESIQIKNDESNQEDDQSDNKESENENELEISLKKRKTKEKKKKSSIVDDKFFKLNELDEYLTKEEKKEKQNNLESDDESVDLFNNFSENEDEEQYKIQYADFFDSPENENEQYQRHMDYDDDYRKVELLNRDEINREQKQEDKKLKFNLTNDSDETDSSESKANEKEQYTNENEEEHMENDDYEEEDHPRLVDEDEETSDGEEKEEFKDKRVRFNIINSESDTDSLENKANQMRRTNEKEHIENDTEPKSSLETRQEKLLMRIKELEEEAIGEKPWQLKGEVTGSSRPQNSLLQEYVEFDVTTRPPPVITEQTMVKLEDIIKQRIKDKAWDDVQKKFKPVETPLEYKKKLVLDQEKSKESLSQIYENEYLKQKQALDPENNKKEEIPELHKEIQEMIRTLIPKLDALSNYHYTPKQAQPEIKIINNMPAINMEEVAPVATSDAALLAPEEIKAKPRGDLIGKSERTKTDMKRERRQKKLKQRAKQQRIEKKSELKARTSGITKKYDKKENAMLIKKLTKDRKITMENETTHKVAKSSTAFFAQLQDQVKSQLKAKTIPKSKKKDNKALSAVKLKL